MTKKIHIPKHELHEYIKTMIFDRHGWASIDTLRRIIVIKRIKELYPHIYKNRFDPRKRFRYFFEYIDGSFVHFGFRLDAKYKRLLSQYKLTERGKITEVLPTYRFIDW